MTSNLKNENGWERLTLIYMNEKCKNARLNVSRWPIEAPLILWMFIVCWVNRPSCGYRDVGSAFAKHESIGNQKKNCQNLAVADFISLNFLVRLFHEGN